MQHDLWLSINSVVITDVDQLYRFRPAPQGACLRFASSSTEIMTNIQSQYASPQISSHEMLMSDYGSTETKFQEATSKSTRASPLEVISFWVILF